MPRPQYAQIQQAFPLYYEKEWQQEDLPPYVRGASSLRRWKGSLLIAQDDISAIALVNPQAPDAVRPLLLPRGYQGRRTFGTGTKNKRYKRDLEASIVLPDGRYVAWGSGSGSRSEREILVIVDPDERLREFPAHSFYAYLRAEKAFSGDDLNLEGALVVNDEIWLFQRGNSAQSHHARVVIRQADFLRYLDRGPYPTAQAVDVIDLGYVDGVAWGITDAVCTPSGNIFVIASAEDTDNPYDDGEVLGSAIGLYASKNQVIAEIELIPILDIDGQPTKRKIEGIAYLSENVVDGDHQFWAVTDDDDEQAVSELLVMTVGRKTSP